MYHCVQKCRSLEVRKRPFDLSQDLYTALLEDKSDFYFLSPPGKSGTLWASSLNNQILFYQMSREGMLPAHIVVTKPQPLLSRCSSSTGREGQDNTEAGAIGCRNPKEECPVDSRGWKTERYTLSKVVWWLLPTAPHSPYKTPYCLSSPCGLSRPLAHGACLHLIRCRL